MPSSIRRSWAGVTPGEPRCAGEPEALSLPIVPEQRTEHHVLSVEILTDAGGDREGVSGCLVLWTI